LEKIKSVNKTKADKQNPKRTETESNPKGENKHGEYEMERNGAGPNDKSGKRGINYTTTTPLGWIVRGKNRKEYPISESEACDTLHSKKYAPCILETYLRKVRSKLVYKLKEYILKNIFF